MAAISPKSVLSSLQPFVRSYIIGYGATVGPQLLSLVLKRVGPLCKDRNESYEECQRHERNFLQTLANILTTGLDTQRLPMFCAILVGGSSVFQKPLYSLLSSSIAPLSSITKLRLSRWLSSFISAWASLWLLQTRQTPSNLQENSETVNGDKPNKSRLAGRTIDLTLFTVVRAMDVIVSKVWTHYQANRKAGKTWTKAQSLILYMVNPAIFAISCGLIMWSWFFHPERLPPRYNKWITSAAQVDQRTIQVLRQLHDGSIVYGEKTDKCDLTVAICRDYNLPDKYGDPAKTWPFPCIMFHTGNGTTCEERAVKHFIKSWRLSMFTYLPLTFALHLRHPSTQAILRSFVSASRSSAFLATYITLSYYGICFARSRIGTLVAGKDIAKCQRLDSGISVGVACALCGCSILVEAKSRHKDMALFVAPKALGTLIPRQYPVEKEWQERLVFALSAAILVTCVQENPKRVRGWLGRAIAWAIRE